MNAAPPPVQSRSLRVTGVVQGVGFRPFVHRLAVRHALTGSVRNVAGEVQIGVQGSEDAISAFIAALTREAPPLARIEQVTIAAAVVDDRNAFDIEVSTDPAGLRQPVSPDVALCTACEAELFDPGDRRYRYPFITCTDCGPRFTIIDAMPYDRERTSMRRFAQCPECEREFRSPGDRRFHSQTNSCGSCGPRLWFESASNAPHPASADPIEVAAATLIRGGVVAVRGLGGFHLTADATSDSAVRRLRQRKHREAKPFAVMVRTLAQAAMLVEIPAGAAEMLTSPTRPVVVLRSRTGSGLSPAIAPELDSIGVMLPSTPLHHLLLDATRRPLVMTSGNLGDEPIAIDNAEARTRLARIADGFLLHDRDIVSRYDDSVLRPAGSAAIILRRARGLAPLPLRLPVTSPQPIVAVGPHLKNTFTLVDGNRAYVSQHIGDLESLETVTHFRETLRRFEELFQITPEVAVRDLHPGYLSTRLARELGLPRLMAVQHHHAHIAAILAEHQVDELALGIAFDGTGYGDDDTTWGAEFLVADLAGYRRVAHLRNAPMPGGDLASREPWRAALGYLSLEPLAAAAFAAAFTGIPANVRDLAERQIARQLNAPLASSMGRLFDAVSAVIGSKQHSRFEGEAAMHLEALAGHRAGRPLPLEWNAAGDVWIMNPLPLLVALGERCRRGDDPADLSADFHATLIAATTELARAACERFDVRTVVLGGGSFQNVRLATQLPAALEARHLRVLMARELGPNDGAVSYGQAAIAATRLARALHQPGE